MKPNNNLEDIKIKLLPFKCISKTTSVAEISIINNGTANVKLDSDSFVFKGLYNQYGNSIYPKVLYDPVRKLTNEVFIIEPEIEKIVNIPFNDLNYFDLFDENVLIEFEYLNLTKSSGGTLIGKIQIDAINVKVCK